MGSGDSWRAQCVNWVCSSRTIADTGFRCTNYSSVEDWSMGENNFTYSFPSNYKEWVVRYINFLDTKATYVKMLLFSFCSNIILRQS